MRRIRHPNFTLLHAAVLAGLIAAVQVLGPHAANPAEPDSGLLHKATFWISHPVDCSDQTGLDV